MDKIKFWLLGFCLVSIPLMAQDTLTVPQIELAKKERKKMEFAGVYKSSISVELGGKSGFVGVSYDLLLSKYLRIGVGAGYPGIGGELKCFPFGVQRDKLLLSVGARATVMYPTGTNFMFYSIPVGISFFNVSRMNLEVDCGPLFKRPMGGGIPFTGFANDINYVWFSVKLGYRFSFYAMKRARQLDRQSD